jgi:2-methylisocitrate lyase-like PEP mutase family enzyme
VEAIQQARARVTGPLSFMRGKLPRSLSRDEHQALGVHIAWSPAFTHEVMYAALWDFMQDLQARGLAAWDALQASRQGRPYPHPLRRDSGETVAKQRVLEERSVSPSGLATYQRVPGGRRPTP